MKVKTYEKEGKEEGKPDDKKMRQRVEQEEKNSKGGKRREDEIDRHVQGARMNPLPSAF